VAQVPNLFRKIGDKAISSNAGIIYKNIDSAVPLVYLPDNLTNPGSVAYIPNVLRVLATDFT